jgi:hypothetical protein
MVRDEEEETRKYFSSERMGILVVPKQATTLMMVMEGKKWGKKSVKRQIEEAEGAEYNFLVP